MTEKDYILAHSLYERKVYRILIKEFRAISKRLNYKDLNESTAAIMVRMAVDKEALTKALMKCYILVGDYFGREQLKEFQKYEKTQKRITRNTYPLFSKGWQAWVIDYLRKVGGSKIVTLTDTFISAVVLEIIKAQSEITTLEELAEIIEKKVNNPNFYRWQAMRIARTETSMMVNASQYISTDYTSIVIDKVWHHYSSQNERPSHVDMEGKRIGKLEAFEVDGERMLYPTDSSLGATARNIIQCRCRALYEPRKDANGLFVFK